MSDSSPSINQDYAKALEEYREYYVIKDTLDINVIALDADSPLISDEEFPRHIPQVFRLASELRVVDQQTLSNLRSLGDAASVVADLFNQQNRKLNVLLGYLLRHEDDPEYRQQAFEYGGAGIGFYTEQSFAPGQLVELKLFIPEHAMAIYSIGQVINVEATEYGSAVRVLFRHITDADRDQLIKATLHAQSRLLKQRASHREA